MHPVLDARLRLSESVALRPEPFGALVYHFGSRRLTFLKRPELVAVLRAMDGTRPTRDLLTTCGIREPQWAAFAEAVQELLRTDVLRPVTDAAEEVESRHG